MANIKKKQTYKTRNEHVNVKTDLQSNVSQLKEYHVK